MIKFFIYASVLLTGPTFIINFLYLVHIFVTLTLYVNKKSRDYITTYENFLFSGHFESETLPTLVSTPIFVVGIFRDSGNSPPSYLGQFDLSHCVLFICFSHHLRTN